MAKKNNPQSRPLKQVFWAGSSRKDLQQFPKIVTMTIGQALFDVQTGSKHPGAKPLKGFGGAGVLEVVESDKGNTYRAVYTVQFAGVIYVLHAFQKKSKRSTKTPTGEIQKIKTRLREAEKHYAEWVERQKQK